MPELTLDLFAQAPPESLNPGSYAAVRRGCTCPVMDNAHGHGRPHTDMEGRKMIVFVMQLDCPLHGERKQVEDSRPICEECNLPMHPYADGNKHGWSCDGCGWSWDTEESQ